MDSAIAIADFCQSNAANIDKNGAFAQREFELIREADLLTAPLQASFGGWGAGFNSDVMSETLMLLKHIGRGNLAVGRVYEGHVNALQLIQTLGSEEQIQKYAQDARMGKVFGVWNAEANDGVKVIPVDTGYRLEGAKTFCSGAGYVERPFVNGVLPDGGWQMCIVPMEKVSTVTDESWWEPPGMKATASFKIDFTGVELSQNDLIAQAGDYYRQPWLTAGVIRFAAVQLGGAEAIFDATREFLRLLQRTEDAYQKQRLGQMAIAIESGNLWLKGAADKIAAYAPVFGDYATVKNPQADQLVAYTNMVRAAIEQICIDIMQLCERCVGTRGLLPPHPMERLIRDLTLYLRQPAFDIAIANPGEYAATKTESVHSLWK
ncbi:acyl-CoA dehydrogenase family protein [Rivularia sp. UHCC 0363]|uniref:acyl-CoA dehydrogenase family protein n=1 Tax=Rivularia sp. UHCC 0363 TaxID=3110244 RepID=UPI002B20B4B6|nr:acyl-CoA dehydrogenase family protein [Rivularia sp. UHCC 0363]MEA5598896.1 acyl-CoA dehydrogenase family protein [Rivularia sp. UHCC 0363]